MNHDWLHLLETWREFYLLIGTAGATLLALMFVVVTLGPQAVAQQTATGVRAFFTPIVVVFTTTTVVSALMMTPGLTPVVLGAMLAIVGLAGVCYLLTTGAHTQWRLNNMLRIDWIWFVGMPILSYALLLVAAVGVWREATLGLYGVEAAVLLLLVMGIRNAWDVVLWIANQPRS